MAVKLSSWRWRGQQALRLHPRAEVGTVADTVVALLEKLEEEESVLVEAVCPPARLPCPGESPLSRPGVGAWLRLPAAAVLGSGLPVSPQERPRQVRSWLCGSVLWCVGYRGTGPC